MRPHAIWGLRIAMGVEGPMEPYGWGPWTLLDLGGCAKEPGSPKISRSHPGHPENRGPVPLVLVTNHIVKSDKSDV